MEFLKDFGFNIKYFVAQIINFLILAWIFKRFLYKPILNIMKQREEKIKQGLENAESSKKALEQASIQRAEIVKNARLEAEKIINASKRIADEAKQEIIDSSKLESDRIISKAREHASMELKKLESDIKLQSLSFSMEILDNTIKSLFTEEEKKKILERAAEKIKENKSS